VDKNRPFFLVMKKLDKIRVLSSKGRRLAKRMAQEVGGVFAAIKKFNWETPLVSKQDKGLMK
jgi:hypothetical protein